MDSDISNLKALVQSEANQRSTDTQTLKTSIAAVDSLLDDVYDELDERMDDLKEDLEDLEDGDSDADDDLAASIVVRPDPAGVSYHWLDWSQPLFVLHPDDGGLKWDLIEWQDNP